jgi:glycosyltransferase involved in cell wall biosynthesis
MTFKIAVYTISLNEEKHVERWYESCKDADYLLIADTGSTDKTVGIAVGLGIKVVRISINPFRFDDARNASLALLPPDIDYCIALDMDEELAPGWREALEKIDPSIDRPSYRRIEAFNPDGSPNLEFNGFKVHRRNGIRWNYPIHEVPQWYKEEEEVKGYIEGFEIHHRQDKTKSRAQYLQMLEQAAKENPDSRNLYYLGREYYYYKRFEESAKTLKEYLKLSIFPEERSAACRTLSSCEPTKAEEWLLQGIDEHYNRESVLALAHHYYQTKQWEECLLIAKKAIEITERPMGFLSENWAWGHMAHDLIAVSSWQLNDFKTALEHGLKAVEISPNDERLQSNVTFYRSKVDANTKSADVRGAD